MAMKRITGPDGLPYLIDTQEDDEQSDNWANSDFLSALEDSSSLTPISGIPRSSEELDHLVRYFPSAMHRATDSEDKEQYIDHLVPKFPSDMPNLAPSELLPYLRRGWSRGADSKNAEQLLPAFINRAASGEEGLTPSELPPYLRRGWPRTDNNGLTQFVPDTINRAAPGADDAQIRGPAFLSRLPDMQGLTPLDLRPAMYKELSPEEARKAIRLLSGTMNGEADPFAGLQFSRRPNPDDEQKLAAPGSSGGDRQAATPVRGLLLRAMAANDDIGPDENLTGQSRRADDDMSPGSGAQGNIGNQLGLLNKFSFPQSSAVKSVPASFIRQSELYARTPSALPLFDEDVDINPSRFPHDPYMPLDTRLENDVGGRAISGDAINQGQEKAWDEGLSLHDGPATDNKVSAEEGERLTAKLLRSRLLQAREDSDKALTPIGARANNSPEAIAVAMGQDVARMKKGMTGKDMKADRATFNKNTEDELHELDAIADREGYSAANRAMLKNTYALARYGALNKDNPDFMWTKLGIFAANTVRHGLVQSHNSADALDGLGPILPLMSGASGILGGMSVGEAANLTRAMADETLKGQIDVLKDVGGLSVMHKMYGSAAMKDAAFESMSDAARDSFKLQRQAEEARDRGDMQGFYRLQTDAAIQMGRHEQSNLQTMWDKPSMAAFSKLNAMLLKETGMALVHPDIYIGTNRDTDKTNTRNITVPQGSEDLTSLENRVNIARNGFNTINEMRQTPEGNNLLNFHQRQLGSGSRLIKPFFKPDWWKFNT
ncbi:hypothetical protein UNDYM_4214 [Undibacterium sp. YM2]|uniref:hypothetical protein n=1 Tax=Undibacterium sp. YM2 TaxID=2058625 RepID=UPI001331D77D|nr:hypothetical protein [Undibacterium sp. YM2]BBB68467.1 hypothetical protein UNDYM_4214 [Undibacterium sp. YM2]